VGRPFDFALALGGWMGVKSAHDRLKQELTTALRVTGTPTIAAIRADSVRRATA
jgi:isopentenyl diphosphate isomerase/L-lactate dehydrogenase-like FMN-dependent dehydrogenase